MDQASPPMIAASRFEALAAESDQRTTPTSEGQNWGKGAASEDVEAPGSAGLSGSACPLMLGKGRGVKIRE